MIYLGADHAGYKLKEKIKKYLDGKKIKYKDLGGDGKPDDDYPDFAVAVGRKVARNKGSFGILICKTGQGMCMVVNKMKGIRGGVGCDSVAVKLMREHNNANVLCLGAGGSVELVKVFLGTKFSGDARHRRRIGKISRIGKSY